MVRGVTSILSYNCCRIVLGRSVSCWGVLGSAFRKIIMMTFLEGMLSAVTTENFGGFFLHKLSVEATPHDMPITSCPWDLFVSAPAKSSVCLCSSFEEAHLVLTSKQQRPLPPQELHPSLQQVSSSPQHSHQLKSLLQHWRQKSWCLSQSSWLN
jgi:hypothetical protein